MEHGSHSSSRKHFLIVLACCLIPLAGLGVAWFLGVPLGTLGIFVLMLLCVGGHIFLMRGVKH
jgi:hypothetical protein